MITIGGEQLAAMEAAFVREQRARFAKRLAADPSIELGEVSGETLARQVEDGCQAANALKIDAPEAIYRFLRLRYVPAAIWEEPGVQELMMRVLRDTSLAADVRLGFVERNIAFQRGRRVDAVEVVDKQEKTTTPR